MTPATELPPGAFELPRWRPLLAACLAVALAACGSSDPNASLLSEELLDTGVQQQAVSWTLGASYDSTKANINFRVYSSRATRIEVYIYKTAYGAQEVVNY